MEGLVCIENGKALINSRDVARYFEKSHRDVLRAIDNIMDKDESTKDMFTKHIREYNGRDFRYFLMNRDGFLLLALGFTGKSTIAKRKEILNMFDNVDTLGRQDEKPMESKPVRIKDKQVATDRDKVVELYRVIDNQVDEIVKYKKASAMFYDVYMGLCSLPDSFDENKSREEWENLVGVKVKDIEQYSNRCKYVKEDKR